MHIKVNSFYANICIFVCLCCSLAFAQSARTNNFCIQEGMQADTAQVGGRQIPCCRGFVRTLGSAPTYCTKCGDGICATPENASNCEKDCGTDKPTVLFLSMDKAFYSNLRIKTYVDSFLRTMKSRAKGKIVLQQNDAGTTTSECKKDVSTVASVKQTPLFCQDPSQIDNCQSVNDCVNDENRCRLVNKECLDASAPKSGCISVQCVLGPKLCENGKCRQRCSISSPQ